MSTNSAKDWLGLVRRGPCCGPNTLHHHLKVHATPLARHPTWRGRECRPRDILRDLVFICIKMPTTIITNHGCTGWKKYIDLCPSSPTLNPDVARLASPTESLVATLVQQRSSGFAHTLTHSYSHAHFLCIYPGEGLYLLLVPLPLAIIYATTLCWARKVEQPMTLICFSRSGLPGSNRGTASTQSGLTHYLGRQHYPLNNLGSLLGC